MATKTKKQGTKTGAEKKKTTTRTSSARAKKAVEVQEQAAVVQEEVKMLPFGDVWEAYLESCGLSESFYPQVAEYEKKVLSKRK